MEDGARGLYQEATPAEGVRYARVRFDDGSELDIVEALYRENGYEPDFDGLPSKRGL